MVIRLTANALVPQVNYLKKISFIKILQEKYQYSKLYFHIYKVQWNGVTVSVSGLTSNFLFAVGCAFSFSTAPTYTITGIDSIFLCLDYCQYLGSQCSNANWSSVTQTCTLYTGDQQTTSAISNGDISQYCACKNCT